MANRVDSDRTLCSAVYGLSQHMTHVTSEKRECLYFRGHLALPSVTEGSKVFNLLPYLP